MLERLREHFAACPLLEENAPIHVDGLRPEPVNYALGALGGETVAEEYVDGSSLKRFPFAFSAMLYGLEDGDRLESDALMETLAAWMEAPENLPLLEEGQKANRMRVPERGGRTDTSGGDAFAAYRMKCELEYVKAGA